MNARLGLCLITAFLISFASLGLHAGPLLRSHHPPRCRLVASAGAELHREVLDRGGVLLQSSTAEAGARWHSVELRTLPGKPGISCTFVDASARVSRRYAGDEIDVKLTQLLEAQPWQPPAPLDGEEADTEKSWLLGVAPPAASAATLPFLSALELKQQSRKLKQIQAFLRAMFDVGPHGVSLIGVRPSEPLGGDLRARRHRHRQQEGHGRAPSQDEAPPLLVVDYGCGAAFLTFALHHVLAEAVGLGADGVRSVGVDRMGHLVERHRAVAAQLGWRMCFADGQIGGFSAARAAAEAEAEEAAAEEAAAEADEAEAETEAETSGGGASASSGGGGVARRIDVAVALHACDTATDDALVEAVSGGAQLIFAAPCTR